MSSPNYAFKDTDCAICAGLIQEGDYIYFNEDGKLCERCAEHGGLVCPQCKGQKKDKYKSCYGCTGKTKVIKVKVSKSRGAHR